MTHKIAHALAEQVFTAADTLKRWHLAEPNVGQLTADLETLSCSITFGWAIIVNASGDKRLLTQIVKRLRQAGYKTLAAPPEPNATSWQPTYHREVGESFYNLPLDEREQEEAAWPGIYLFFTSTVCKQVQVGTEMKEVPIYKIECGEALELVSEEEATQ